MGHQFTSVSWLCNTCCRAMFSIWGLLRSHSPLHLSFWWVSLSPHGAWTVAGLGWGSPLAYLYSSYYNITDKHEGRRQQDTGFTLVNSFPHWSQWNIHLFFSAAAAVFFSQDTVFTSFTSNSLWFLQCIIFLSDCHVGKKRLETEWLISGYTTMHTLYSAIYKCHQFALSSCQCKVAETVDCLLKTATVLLLFLLTTSATACPLMFSSYSFSCRR